MGVFSCFSKVLMHSAGTENPCFGSEQKRPGANRPPEFVPESPLQKGVFGSHIFSKEL